MANLPDRDADRFIAKILTNGLWHTTSLRRYQSICKCGAIKVEPEIPNAERQKTGRGPEYYSFVRSLGGVSLFDFRDFEASQYQEKFPASSYHYFVPIRREWPEAVWIEIDRNQTAANFISGQDLLLRWKHEEAQAHTIMPKIETAHIGDIPATCFKRALMVSTDGDRLTIDEIDLSLTHSA